MLFLSIKKKHIVIALIFILLLSVFLSLPSLVVSTRVYRYCVVIDAGHGGSDGGSVSPFSGIDENHINLEYANCLKSLLENAGVKTVMTRENLNGLYPIYSTNRKQDDMKARKKIIENSNANLVVSIHMNSFPMQSSYGCQTFFNPNNPASVYLANTIQNLFVQNLANARKTAQAGDYYILNCSNTPSVLVECGFLSNQQEEKLLQTQEYKTQICSLIAYGIIMCLS